MENKLLVHKHLIIRAEVARPPQSESFFRVWLNFFIKEIGMKTMSGPHVKYSHVKGNKGLTGVAVIETSHIAAHFWDEISPALMQFDVYSCSEFDPIKICNKIKKDFGATKIAYKFLDREHDLTEIPLDIKKK